MKVSTSVYHEITNAENDGEHYIATHHTQPVYTFICETDEDKNKVEAFLLLCLPVKKVKK